MNTTILQLTQYIHPHLTLRESARNLSRDKSIGFSTAKTIVSDLNDFVIGKISEEEVSTFLQVSGISLSTTTTNA